MSKLLAIACEKLPIILVVLLVVDGTTFQQLHPRSLLMCKTCACISLDVSTSSNSPLNDVLAFGKQERWLLAVEQKLPLASEELASAGPSSHENEKSRARHGDPASTQSRISHDV